MVNKAVSIFLDSIEQVTCHKTSDLSQAHTVKPCPNIKLKLVLGCVKVDIISLLLIIILLLFGLWEGRYNFIITYHHFVNVWLWEGRYHSIISYHFFVIVWVVGR